MEEVLICSFTRERFEKLVLEHPNASPVNRESSSHGTNMLAGQTPATVTPINVQFGGEDRRWRLYAFSFKAIRATCAPWYRAPASSLSLGIRSPWLPAMVEAP